MSIDRARIAILLTGVSLLAGCATNPLFEEPGDAAFGEANKQTLMAQVVDPAPVYDHPMVNSGAHAADAVARYRTDTVKQPESIKTTNVGSGGGGSSGGGSGGS